MLLWYRARTSDRVQVCILLRKMSYTLSDLGEAHARMGGPFGNRGSNESREQTIANGMYNWVFDGTLT